LIALERALAEKESRLDVLKQLNEEGEVSRKFRRPS